MTFSEKIILMRERAKLTQQQLADLTGISRRTIVSYECNGAIARASTMRKLATALGVSYDYLANDEITDPEYGLEKAPYVEEVRGALGNKAAKEVDKLLEQNAALFAGGELSEEAKDAFYLALTKAYLQCKEEASKKFGRKK
jgi:transcriptional regulator with XRE-family HTH domain|nr:MAG TPA: helix-turn-helix domain protein [Caudoviricetes sp.]DAV48930.1 MAG TPA: helix-turn-helix domain protein [Caudoviricetes sp.]